MRVAVYFRPVGMNVFIVVVLYGHRPSEELTSQTRGRIAWIKRIVTYHSRAEQTKPCTIIRKKLRNMTSFFTVSHQDEMAPKTSPPVLMTDPSVPSARAGTWKLVPTRHSCCLWLRARAADPWTPAAPNRTETFVNVRNVPYYFKYKTYILHTFSRWKIEVRLKTDKMCIFPIFILNPSFKNWMRLKFDVILYFQ
jgi:hypothetical protein